MDSRTKHTKRNILVVMFTNGFELLARFLVRTAILHLLGSEYLGLSSLFTSILQVLNMAELGFSSAIIYNMYKPIADQDTDAVCRLLNYYRHIYTLVGSVMLTAGLVIAPFVPNLVKGSWPQDINIYYIYVLYLVDSSISYFLYAYKESILRATQRLDIAKCIHVFSHIGKYSLQLVALYFFRNYYLFLVISIIGTAVNNLIVKIYTDKAYPNYYCRGEIDETLKQSVKKQVGGLMVSKISAMSRNSFDSIILSSTLGLTAVAIYNNYYFILSGVFVILNYTTQAMQASVGNSIAVNNTEKNHNDLNKFQFLYSWIVCMASTCMICLYQPVMTLWAGESLLLTDLNMVLFCIYFYISNLPCVIDLYFVGNGLWWRGKLFYVLEAGGNLLLNILLGKIWGVTGVLIATNITMLVLRFLPTVVITFKHYFHSGLSKFFLWVLRLSIVTAASCSLSFIMCTIIPEFNVWGTVFVRIVICICISNGLMLICFCKSRVLKDALALLRYVRKIS